MVELKKIPDINEMKKYFQEYINNGGISTKTIDLLSLSRHTTKFFTKFGSDLGYYIRAPNNFQNLPNAKNQYPNDGNLLTVDLVWLTDNPYHCPSKRGIYNWHRTDKAKSEIALALEYEKTGRILNEDDDPIHQCDELWKLSFVMARVKVLVYATSTDNIEKHLTAFRDAISNFEIQQQPAPEWRVFAINGDKIIGVNISPNSNGK